MPFDPIRLTAEAMDLSARVANTTTVVGSPAAGAETTVASLTLSNNVQCTFGVFLFCYVAFTVGTNGVSVNLKLHHTNSSGATVGTTGATTATAANLGSLACLGFEAAASVSLPGQVYIATLTVASGSATSTVAAVQLSALIV